MWSLLLDAISPPGFVLSGSKSRLWGPLNKLRRARWQSDFYGASPSRWFPAPLAMTNGPSSATVERSSGDQKAMKGDSECVSLELLAESRFIGSLTFGLCLWLRWKEVNHYWGEALFKILRQRCFLLFILQMLFLIQLKQKTSWEIRRWRVRGQRTNVLI